MIVRWSQITLGSNEKTDQIKLHGMEIALQNYGAHLGFRRHLFLLDFADMGEGNITRNIRDEGENVLLNLFRS